MAKAKRAKPASGAKPVLQFRVHEYLYEALKKDAAEKRLTISEAAANILSQYVSERPLFSGIEKTMMWISSAFWHSAKMTALERGLSHSYDDSGDWMKDPECYRAGVLTAINTLLQASVISSPAERKKTAQGIAELVRQYEKSAS